MKKLIAGLLALFVATACFGQTFTVQNLVVNGTFSAPGAVSLSSLATQAANTVVANATGSTASPTAFAMPSCSAATNALTWTSATGFTCNSSINAATLGGATFASPGPIGSTTKSTGAFTSVTATGTVLGGSPSALIGIQVFTNNGTYTPDAGTNTAVIEAIGGGGGGGGAATTGSSQCSVGAGGGAGAYSYGSFAVGSVSGQTITIGAAGAGNSGAAGGNGGTTSIGTLLVAGGGTGGGTAAAAANNYQQGGAGGTTATGGIASRTGDIGNDAWCEGSIGAFTAGGRGASSIYGSGGQWQYEATGSPGTGFGAGGGGTGNPQSVATARTGGAGAKGLLVIFEYN